VRGETGDSRGEREHAGGDRHRDREYVVDQQRGGPEQARKRAEVLLGDDVRATARLVGADGLAIGDDDDREQQGDGHRDGPDLVRRRRRGCDEHDETRLCGVGDGGERIGCEHR
jgi:hypothetical protein